VTASSTVDDESVVFSPTLPRASGVYHFSPPCKLPRQSHWGIGDRRGRNCPFGRARDVFRQDSDGSQRDSNFSFSHGGISAATTAGDLARIKSSIRYFTDGGEISRDYSLLNSDIKPRSIVYLYLLCLQRIAAKAWTLNFTSALRTGFHCFVISDCRNRIAARL
jgi:hypothetical protein